MPLYLTAHDIAASPDLFFEIVTFGDSKVEWECMGYTKDGEGKTIRFARLVELPNGKIHSHSFLLILASSARPTVTAERAGGAI